MKLAEAQRLIVPLKRTTLATQLEAAAVGEVVGVAVMPVVQQRSAEFVVSALRLS